METSGTGKNLLQMYEESPAWAKGVIDLFILGSVAYGTFVIIKAVKKAKSAANSNAVANASHNTYQDLLNTGQTLTFPESSYLAAANTIQDLLDGCETSLSEAQAVEEVAKVVKNKIDWYKLVAVFGSRVIDNCGPWTGDTTYDLITLLKDQIFTWMPNLTAYLAKFGVSI